MYATDDPARCIWPAGAIDSLPKMAVPPPKHEIPINGNTFPESPVWTLVKDEQYTSGWVYEAPYTISTQKPQEKAMMLTVTSPQSVAATYDPSTGVFSPHPIEGMVQMVPGIPYVYRVKRTENDSDPPRSYTVSCTQTLDSLQHYDDFSIIKTASNVVIRLLAGSPSENIPPLSSYNLKPNDRSAAQPVNSPNSDGSSSLATTLMEGASVGTIVPASQICSIQGKRTIAKVLEQANILGHHILPKCLSKFEYEIIRWKIQFNNVVQFGPYPIGPTSVQYNVSSLGQALARSLGYQGAWHPDPKDCWTMYTLLIMCINCGPSERFEFLFQMQHC